MATSVLHQVIAAHEALVAKRAAELLFPRVSAVVAGQLIRASKLLTAVRPGAWERPFSCSTQRKTKTCQCIITLDHGSMTLRTILVFLVNGQCFSSLRIYHFLYITANQFHTFLHNFPMCIIISIFLHVLSLVYFTCLLTI